MAGNWQMARNSRWAHRLFLAAASGFCLSQTSAVSGLPTAGCPEGFDTRSRDGRSSTAGVHCPPGVQNRVGVLPVRVLRASSGVQASTATTTWSAGSTSWSGSS